MVSARIGLPWRTQLAGAAMLALSSAGCMDYNITAVGILLPADRAFDNGIRLCHEMGIPIGEDVWMPTVLSVSSLPLVAGRESGWSVSVAVLFPLRGSFHVSGGEIINGGRDSTWSGKADFMLGFGVFSVDGESAVSGILGPRLLVAHKSKWSFEMGYVWCPVDLDTNLADISDAGGGYVSLVRIW